MARLWAVLIALLLWITPAVAQPADNGIVFVSTRGGYRDIYWMSADGETVEQLTNDIAQDLHPAWSPDGTQIAFVSDRDDSYAIYVMNPDGSGVRRVVSGNRYYEFPTWSPDGQNLVYSSDEAGSFDLYRVDLTGGQPYPLTTSDEDESDPTWSPDGRQIAYLQSVDGANEIFVIDANGGSPRPFIPGGVGDFAAPRWSPDGTHLAYAVMTYDTAGNVAELYIYEPATNEERLLTSIENSFITGISWSADGNNIVYDQKSSGKEVNLFQIGINGDYTNLLLEGQFPSWSTPLGDEVPDPTDQPCSGNDLPPRLRINENARVTLYPDLRNRVRAAPGTDAEILTSIDPGTMFRVIGGPICANNINWWEIEVGSIVGWTAEGSDGEYYLEPQ